MLGKTRRSRPESLCFLIAFSSLSRLNSVAQLISVCQEHSQSSVLPWAIAVTQEFPIELLNLAIHISGLQLI